MNHIHNQFTTDQPTLLYGGAISVQLPAGLLDASNIRPVPDTQEVFVSATPDSLVTSVIVDLLECVDADTLDGIIEAQAAELGLISASHTSTTPIVNTQEPLITIGGYRIYNQHDAASSLCVGVLRLGPPAISDVVVTVVGSAEPSGGSSATEPAVARCCATLCASFLVLQKSLFS